MSTRRLFGDGLENEACSPRKTCFKVRGSAVRIRVNQVGRGGGERLPGFRGPSWARCGCSRDGDGGVAVGLESLLGEGRKPQL